MESRERVVGENDVFSPEAGGRVFEILQLYLLRMQSQVCKGWLANEKPQRVGKTSCIIG